MREIIEEILKKYKGTYYIGKESTNAYYIYSIYPVFSKRLILDINKKFNEWYITDTWAQQEERFFKITCIVIKDI